MRNCLSIKPILLSFFLCLFTISAFSQSTIFSIQNADTIKRKCSTICDSIYTQFNNKLTTNYTFTTATYSPISFTGVPYIQYQDSFSGAIPIGFAFCFYGNSYSQCYISDNGILTFNSFYNHASCNANFQNAIPYFNNTFPNNAIFMPACDLDPSQGGTTKYITLGTAPYRKFVLDYSNYKLYGSTCSNINNSFQIILYEGTNIIEFHISKKIKCDNATTTASNYAILGMQNNTTLQYHTIAAKNATIWADSNICYTAKPSGTDNTTTFNWYDNGTLVSSGNNKFYNSCPTIGVYPKRIVCKVTTQCPALQYQDSIYILLPPPPPVIDSLQYVQPYCLNDANGSISVFSHSTTGIPYSYVFSGIPATNNVFNNLLPMFYQISLWDTNSCKVDTVVELLPQILPPIVNPIPATCPDSNGSMVIIPNTAALPYTILWSTGQTSLSIQNLKPGQYSVSIVDAFGCTYTGTYVIVYNGLPYISSFIATPSLCTPTGTATIVAAGGTPPYTYVWSGNPSTSTIITNAFPGPNFVTITDSNNCIGTGGIIIPAPIPTTISVNTIGTKCDSANGKATVSILTGLPPFTYLWSNGATTSSISNVPSGNYTITVTSQTTFCSTTTAINIATSPKLQVLASVGNQNCDTSNGTILTNMVNANPPLNYLWSNGTTDSNANYLVAGTYSVTIKDAIGCQTKKTIVVGNDGAPHLTIVSYQPPQCYGDSNGQVTLIGFLGKAPYKYSLTGSIFTTNSTIGNVWGGSYPIYIQDANSCNKDTFVTFPQPALLGINAIVNAVKCIGDSNASITLNGVGGTPPYLYNFNNTVYNTNTNFTQLPTGNYPVITIDKNLCTDTSNIFVASPDSLRLTVDTKVLDCISPNSGIASVTLSGGWGSYFVKNGAAVPTQFDTINLPVNQNITLAYTDIQGCEISKQILVSQVYNCCKVKLPNAFTPNDDNTNDVFKIIAPIYTTEYLFSIYNRWGKKVFETTDNSAGWNGRQQNNQACEGGVYFYVLKYTCINANQPIIETGDVLLMY